MLIKIYLRREPSTETKGRFDVVAYSDASATDVKARWSWWMASKPTRRNKRVMLNCWPWQVVWL